MQRSVIDPAQAERIINAARRAGGDSDMGAVKVLMCFVRHFGRISPTMRTAVALELVRNAIMLDPDIECVRWN
jgi:hypothetical protein